jgi:hypothetical protein
MYQFLIGGRVQLLDQIETFCREVYYRAFTPEEAELRLKKLTLINAVALWQAGFPLSRK